MIWKWLCGLFRREPLSAAEAEARAADEGARHMDFMAKDFMQIGDTGMSDYCAKKAHECRRRAEKLRLEGAK